MFIYARHKINYLYLFFVNKQHFGAILERGRNAVLCYGKCRYDNVTLIPLVLQLGLRIGPIQRMGAN
jgi:hypothetical protein